MPLQESLVNSEVPSKDDLMPPLEPLDKSEVLSMEDLMPLLEPPVNSEPPQVVLSMPLLELPVNSEPPQVVLLEVVPASASEEFLLPSVRDNSEISAWDSDKDKDSAHHNSEVCLDNKDKDNKVDSEDVPNAQSG